MVIIQHFSKNHLSEEHRNKISLGMIGKLKGIPKSLEHRLKLSLSLKGRKKSESYKQNMSRIKNGHPVSELTKHKISQALYGKKVPIEVRKKISETKKGNPNFKARGKPRSEETRIKISQRLKGRKTRPENYRHSEETKRKISESSRGRPCSIATREKIRLALKAYCANPIVRKKLRQLSIASWSNPEVAEKIIRLQQVSLHMKPNKPEKLLLNLLDAKFPNQWKYTGDGSLILGGKCPDFCNTNGKKKVIELYGTYWHRNDNPKDRIEHFAKYQYKCLVVWENELNHPDSVLERIAPFVEVN